MNLLTGHWGAAEAFYHSWGHQPFQFWILQGAFLLWLLIQREKNLRKGGRIPHAWALAGFTVLAALDAWLTTDTPVGIGKLTPLAAQWIAITFVILGDLRFFWFALPGKVRLAVGLSFVTPVLAALLRSMPGFPATELRWVFFSYELIFLAVLTALLLVGPRLRLLKEFGTERTRRIAGFAGLYYVFWATADALLFCTGPAWLLEFAWSLRLIANLLYYGGLLPWIVATKTTG